jgi:hypothetical protein
MFFFVLSMATAVSNHPTWLIYFAATEILKAQAAVIKVTAGGETDPTSPPIYMWADADGIMLANLTVDTGGVLIASGDVKTGGGNSVSANAEEIEALKAQLAATEAIIASLQVNITTQQAQIQGLLSATNLLTFLSSYAHANYQVGPGFVTRHSGTFSWNEGAARTNVGYNSGERVTIEIPSCQDAIVGFVPASFNINSAYTDVPYAIMCGSGHRMVYESGNMRMRTSGITGTMSLTLNTDGTVHYSKNGAVIYTSLITNTQWPLYVGVVGERVGYGVSGLHSVV